MTNKPFELHCAACGVFLLCFVFIALCSLSNACAEADLPNTPSANAPTTIPVWPDLAPGETTKDTGRAISSTDGITRITDITSPQILLFRAPGAGAHPAVLVSPGGGYGYVTLNLEGTEIAQWLNTLGFTAAVLEYRTPNNREGAFQDGQRALRDLRFNAKAYGIDPKRLGVMGFSAGGHLSARLATQYDVKSYAPIDAVDHESARPDFAVLVYPAYLIDKTTEEIAPEVQPHAGMPPFFLTQTMDDPFLCAPVYATALRAAGIPTHTVFYANGHHGYGMNLPVTVPAHAWPMEAAAWLQKTEHP